MVELGVTGFGILLAVAAIYVMIGSDLSQSFEVAGTEIAVPDDEASIAEGERLARLRGCYDGCHGKATTGSILIEMPDGTHIVAPDLGRAARKYSIEELDRLIRHGIITVVVFLAIVAIHGPLLGVNTFPQ